MNLKWNALQQKLFQKILRNKIKTIWENKPTFFVSHICAVFIPKPLQVTNYFDQFQVYSSRISSGKYKYIWPHVYFKLWIT